MNDFLIQLSKNLNLDYSKDYMTAYGQYKNYQLSISEYRLNEESTHNSYLIKFPFSKNMKKV